MRPPRQRSYLAEAPRKRIVRRSLLDVALVVVVIGLGGGFLTGTLVWFVSTSSSPESATTKESKRARRETAEIALGDFDYRFGHDPGEKAVRVIRFRAVGIYNGREHDFFELTRRLSSYHSRVRAAFASTTAAVNDEQVVESDLATLRGNLRSNLNDVLGTPFFDDVVLNDFACFDAPLVLDD